MRRILPDGRKLTNTKTKRHVFRHCPGDPCRDAGSCGRLPVYTTVNGELYVNWNQTWELLVHLGTDEESGRELGRGNWYEVVGTAGGS